MNHKRFTLGVLMLDTRFTRIRGEVGHPETFPFPVLVRRVRGADVRRVIVEGDEGLIPLFVAAGRELARAGADLITTTCGFLAGFQDEISRELPVPFISSSLLLIPLIFKVTGACRPVGMITASKRHLDTAHLEGAGAGNIPVRVAGMEECEHFTRAIVREEIPLDPCKLEQEVLDVARGFVSENPDISSVVLECTNLSLYRARLQASLHRPVFDIVSAVMFFARGNAGDTPDAG